MKLITILLAHQEIDKNRSLKNTLAVCLRRGNKEGKKGHLDNEFIVNCEEKIMVMSCSPSKGVEQHTAKF